MPPVPAAVHESGPSTAVPGPVIGFPQGVVIRQSFPCTHCPASSWPVWRAAGRRLGSCAPGPFRRGTRGRAPGTGRCCSPRAARSSPRRGARRLGRACFRCRAPDRARCGSGLGVRWASARSDVLLLLRRHCWCCRGRCGEPGPVLRSTCSTALVIAAALWFVGWVLDLPADERCSATGRTRWPGVACPGRRWPSRSGLTGGRGVSPSTAAAPARSSPGSAVIARPSAACAWRSASATATWPLASCRRPVAAVTAAGRPVRSARAAWAVPTGRTGHRRGHPAVVRRTRSCR